jgi:hypothetical protein
LRPENYQITAIDRCCFKTLFAWQHRDDHINIKKLLKAVGRATRRHMAGSCSAEDEDKFSL